MVAVVASPAVAVAAGAMHIVVRLVEVLAQAAVAQLL
jgi:hypothetical protein